MRANAAREPAAISSIGLGLRREIAEQILSLKSKRPAFLEIAPENWMGIGGRWRQILLRAKEQYPLFCHGLSLSLGSPEDLDEAFLKQLKAFFSEISPQLYSEHLSFCKCDNAHLYELLPLPFTEKAIDHVALRIKKVQDFLEMQIAIENVSYYAQADAEMEEAEFLTRIVEKSGCALLLDVNNIYVNGFNHKYDPEDFLRKIPLDKVVYIHMAGHEKVAPDLIIDTHGNPIIDPVYQLFSLVMQKIEPVPVLLERDYNFNHFDQILQEMETLQELIPCLS